MCLVQQWFLLFVLMEITSLLSAYIVIGRTTDSPISLKYLSNHKTCVVTCEKAMSLTSTVDSTIMSCLLIS